MTLLATSDIFADDEFNSRGHVSPASVQTLAEDLKLNGLIQPIVVQPWKGKWRIVCGHRRFEAAKSLGWTAIECNVREDLSDERALVMNVSENLQRQNLNMLQEAKAISRFGWDVKRICREFKVYPQWVEVRLHLLTLPEEIQARAAAGFLTQHQVADIAALNNREAQMEMTRKCVDHKLKGERGSFKIKADPKRILKKGDPRCKEDIFAMQESIQDTFGQVDHPMARSLAWAAGIISDADLFVDLEKLAKVAGKQFKRPA